MSEQNDNPNWVTRNKRWLESFGKIGLISADRSTRKHTAVLNIETSE